MCCLLFGCSTHTKHIDSWVLRASYNFFTFVLLCFLLQWSAAPDTALSDPRYSAWAATVVTSKRSPSLFITQTNHLVSRLAPVQRPQSTLTTGKLLDLHLSSESNNSLQLHAAGSPLTNASNRKFFISANWSTISQLKSFCRVTVTVHRFAKSSRLLINRLINVCKVTATARSLLSTKASARSTTRLLTQFVSPRYRSSPNSEASAR